MIRFNALELRLRPGGETGSKRKRKEDLCTVINFVLGSVIIESYRVNISMHGCSEKDFKQNF